MEIAVIDLPVAVVVVGSIPVGKLEHHFLPSVHIYSISMPHGIGKCFHRTVFLMYGVYTGYDTFDQ
jgi:hypothetical protein